MDSHDKIVMVITAVIVMVPSYWFLLAGFLT